MKVSNQESWQEWVKNNEDPYGKAVIDYAERWATLMEACISEGEALESIAKRTSHEADTEGITGFMAGAAVSVLASCWEYGEQLRCWHNLSTQIHDEGERANTDGGILNPALLNISY